MWNLKYDSNELICKTEIDSWTENRFVVANGEWGMVGEGLGVYDQVRQTVKYRVD